MILVTGAAGHTGSHVVRLLRQRFPQEPVRCLVRATTDRSALAPFDVEFVVGDLSQSADVDRAMAGVRVVVHGANIRFSPLVMAAARTARVDQVVLVHTTGMYSHYRAYAADYLRIEEEISGHTAADAPRWTILRPTMIYGGWRDHNFHKLIRVLNRVPLFPIFGSGQGKMQPVHVEDLAQGIVAAIDNPAAYQQAFNLSGGSVHPYKEILQLVARLLGRRITFIHIPYSLALVGAWLLNRVRRGPVTVEQVRRLAEDKVFDYSAATAALNFRPRPLSEGLRQQLQEMGMVGGPGESGGAKEA